MPKRHKLLMADKAACWLSEGLQGLLQAEISLNKQRTSNLHVLVQIHWFSIINSCVTVLLLTGFLATILMRVLKNDFVKYTKDDEAGMVTLTLCCRANAISCSCKDIQRRKILMDETA